MNSAFAADNVFWLTSTMSSLRVWASQGSDLLPAQAAGLGEAVRRGLT